MKGRSLTTTPSSRGVRLAGDPIPGLPAAFGGSLPPPGWADPAQTTRVMKVPSGANGYLVGSTRTTPLLKKAGHASGGVTRFNTGD